MWWWWCCKFWIHKLPSDITRCIYTFHWRNIRQMEHPVCFCTFNKWFFMSISFHDDAGCNWWSWCIISAIGECTWRRHKDTTIKWSWWWAWNDIWINVFQWNIRSNLKFFISVFLCNIFSLNISGAGFFFMCWLAAPMPTWFCDMRNKTLQCTLKCFSFSLFTINFSLCISYWSFTSCIGFTRRDFKMKLGKISKVFKIIHFYRFMRWLFIYFFSGWGWGIRLDTVFK